MAINYREQYARYSRYFRRLAGSLQRPEVRASVELLLSLLAISFFSLFALRPTLNTIAELRSNISLQAAAKKTMEEKLQNISAAQSFWEEQKTKIDLLDQAMPTRPSPEFYLRQIEGLAAAEGVALSSITFEDAEEPVLVVSFSVIGSYERLSSFLAQLQALRRSIQIETLSFVLERTGPANLTLTVSGKVPYAL